MMNCQEFATLHKYGLTVKTVVLHNSVLGMVNQWQRMFYHGHSAESLLHDGPDLTRVAASMGVTARAVHQPDELAAAVKELMQSDGPALLDVFIPEDENVYPMVPGGKRLDEMVLGD
jgi:acetolactate synthase-1/2/3 large subunit